MSRYVRSTNPMLPPYEEIRRWTQLDRSRSLAEDRAEEIAGFLNISVAQASADYHALNVEFSKKPPAALFATQEHAEVVDSYTNPLFLRQSLTRLMLKYDRFNPAYRTLTAMSRDRGNSNYSGLSILEYGCGAADYALLFSLLGGRPVLADIVGGPVEFASYRMTRRDISHDVVAITRNIQYPELPKVDVVLATEVLEHLLDPPRMIEMFARALRTNGYFSFSDYPLKPKTVSGAHLQVAADLREETIRVLDRLYVQIWADPTVGYIYKLRRACPVPIGDPRCS